MNMRCCELRCAAERRLDYLMANDSSISFFGVTRSVEMNTPAGIEGMRSPVNGECLSHPRISTTPSMNVRYMMETISRLLQECCLIGGQFIVVMIIKDAGSSTNKISHRCEEWMIFHEAPSTRGFSRYRHLRWKIVSKSIYGRRKY